jgi:hypothetical protein
MVSRAIDSRAALKQLVHHAKVIRDFSVESDDPEALVGILNEPVKDLEAAIHESKML